MRNKSIFFIISAIVVIFLSLGMAAEAEEPKVPICEYDVCDTTDIQNGDCTPIRNRFGDFAGYIVTHTSFAYNGTTNRTRSDYAICQVDGTSPKNISHVDLELPNCIDEDNNKISCKVKNAPTQWEVFEDGSGDPSTGYLMWFVSDLLKIDEGSEEVADFFVEVEGEAYETRGNIGLKAGPEMYTGKITVPVCSQDCSLPGYAAAGGGEPPDGERNIVETEDGYKFEIECDANGCCKVLDCFRPGDGWGGCQKTKFKDFFATKEGEKILDISDGESRCINLVIDDESKSSPSYCSGGWCWY